MRLSSSGPPPRPVPLLTRTSTWRHKAPAATVRVSPKRRSPRKRPESPRARTRPRSRSIPRPPRSPKRVMKRVGTIPAVPIPPPPETLGGLRVQDLVAKAEQPKRTPPFAHLSETRMNSASELVSVQLDQTSGSFNASRDRKGPRVTGVAWDSSFNEVEAVEKSFGSLHSPRHIGIPVTPPHTPGPSPKHADTRSPGSPGLRGPSSHSLGVASVTSARTRRRTVTASVLAVRWLGDGDAAECKDVLDVATLVGVAMHGQLLYVSGDSAVLVWNAGQGVDTRHAVAAARAAVRLTVSLRDRRTRVLCCGIGAATGKLLVTESGNGLSAYGAVMQRALLLSSLCPVLSCRVVTDEELRDRLSGCAEFATRQVDVLASLPGATPVPTVVYSLCHARDDVHDDHGVYEAAFDAFARGDWSAAQEGFAAQLADDPGDVDARRLLRIVLARARADKATTARRWLGWEIPERGQELPDSVPSPAGSGSGDDVDVVSCSDADQRAHDADVSHLLQKLVSALTDTGILHRYYHSWRRMTQRQCFQRVGGRCYSDRAVSFHVGSEESGLTSGEVRKSPPPACKLERHDVGVRRGRRPAIGRQCSALLLMRQIRQKRNEKEQAPGHRRLSDASAGCADIPVEIVDHRGNKWHRSKKMLGKGAFGSVWVGMGHDGGLVALKALPIPQGQPETAVGARRRRQARTKRNLDAEITDLVSEVRLLTELRDEHIVRYFGSSVTSHHVVIVMELLPGGCLATLLSHFGRLPASSAVRYTKKMCLGLQFLHGKGIVHRDFKPGNVLLQIDGHCKLADFGASASLEEVQGGGVIGTPLYMAPEQARGKACYSSDIWAMGITLCEMLTGNVPYPSARSSDFSPHRFVYQLSQGGERPTLPRLPPSATAFVSVCLAQDPEERPAASDLLRRAFLLSRWSARRLSDQPPPPEASKSPEESPSVSPRAATLAQTAIMVMSAPVGESDRSAPQSPAASEEPRPSSSRARSPCPSSGLGSALRVARSCSSPSNSVSASGSRAAAV